MISFRDPDMQGLTRKHQGAGGGWSGLVGRGLKTKSWEGGAQANVRTKGTYSAGGVKNQKTPTKVAVLRERKQQIKVEHVVADTYSMK